METKQNSPPTWTQEAHRPPHRKYSLCCSTLGVRKAEGGWVSQFGLGWRGGYSVLSCPGLGGGGVSQSCHYQGVPLSLGTPFDWVPPAWDWGTIPHLGLGYPIRRGLGPVTGVLPQKIHGNSGSVMGWRWDYPPPPQRWTDKQSESITGPLRMRVVKKRIVAYGVTER